IQMFSTSLETLLGWAREEVEGRTWLEAMTPAAHAGAVERRLERALSGTLHAFACEAVTPEGTRFNLHLEAALVGRDFEQGLLLTVTAAEPLDYDRPRPDEDVDYEISTSVSDFGRLLSLKTPRGPAQVPTDPTARCFTVIHGKHEPCADCPVLEQSGSGWPRTTAHRDLTRDEIGYEVVTAEAYGDRIRVRLRRIVERALGAIHESKVRALADSAQLSDRERAVLTYLLMGRSLADIGMILGISPRTVKFHQANVLEKLGADSRADLIRLVT
ncbi:MAG: transcriptional regulator, LuxR family, partial [Labilithrix sp.]|nr:transcriptional regulator, LuxR family [Labilithrix sp.]